MTVRGNNKEDKDGFYAAVTDTLKGKEYELPDGLFFTDKDRTERTECRVRWYNDPASRKTLNDVLME